MKVYMIHLTEGRGDTYISVVDQETWDWINNPDPGKPKGQEDETGWIDQLIPTSQLKMNLEEDPEFEPYLTIGSYENDRAILAKSLPGYDIYCRIKEAMDAIKKNGDEFEDSYEGYMY